MGDCRSGVDSSDHWVREACLVDHWRTGRIQLTHLDNFDVTGLRAPDAGVVEIGFIDWVAKLLVAEIFRASERHAVLRDSGYRARIVRRDELGASLYGRCDGERKVILR